MKSFSGTLENYKNSCSAFTTGKSQQITEATKNNKCKFGPLKPPQTDTSKENNLDISCIAGRTRRKSLASHRVDTQNYKEEIENPLNISCIAKRTRRKTICAQTNYSYKSLFEKSQVYEKIHESDEEFNENKGETKQELELCDGYEEHDRKFETSRTRKRKSLNSHNKRMRKISDDDCSSFSSNSTGFYNIHLRKRCNRRILSSSSEEYSLPSSSLHFTARQFAST